MRIISFLCVMVVLVLNFVPCADVHAEEGNESITIHTPAHQDAPAHTDACTPFCHCSCCASTVVVKLTGAPPVPYKISNAEYLSHFEGRSSDISLPIFQPPKSL